MKTRILFLTFISLGCSVLLMNAQNYQYEPLKASGDIPDDFTQSYFEKVEYQQKKIDKNLNRKERKKQISFHEYNEFVLDMLLTSGKVMYGDEATNYLEEVLDKVLENDMDLRDELRIYAVRSADFNAFTTNNGIILVNLGLLAELETEAQLAFVLCHEIVHYTEEHVRKGFDYRNELARNNRFNYNADKLAKKYYDYSKDQELEADEMGYRDFYKKTGYNKQAPYELLDIMLYSYLPFDEIPFDVDFLSTENYGILKDNLRDYEAKEISAREDVSDSLSTHPNIEARREAMEEFAELKNEGNNYLVSEERFKTLRKQARYESLEQYIQTARYDRAIYQGFLLQKENPNDAFIKRAVAYAVYASSVYKNYYRLPGEVNDMEHVEGELSHVRYILKNMKDEELNTLSVCMTYEFYRDNPEDKLGKRLFEDALWELTHFHEKELDDYAAEPYVADTSDTEENKEEELNTSRKVKRIKASRPNVDFEKYAFASYMNDTLFTGMFKRQQDDVEDYLDRLPRLASRANKAGKRLSLKEVRDTSKLRRDEYYKYPEITQNIGGKGVKSVLIITPESYTLSNGKGINFKKSTQREEDYISAIESGSRATGIDYELFDYKTIGNNQAESFNELQVLQMWFDEEGYHSRMGIVNYMYAKAQPIIEKYDTDYLMYTGTISISTRGMLSNSYGLYGAAALIIAFPPSAPFIVGAGFIPSYTSIQFMQVFDMANDKVVMRKYNEMKHYRSQAIIDNLIYDQLNELSAKPKYKK
jgi:hypothetical protein